MKNSFNGMAAFSQNKRKLFSLLLDEEGVGSASRQVIPRRTDSGFLPLSLSQKGLWFLSQAAPGGVSYNIPAVMPLEGSLDITSLAQALCEVVRRHEILRTTFPTVDGRPVQAISPPGPTALPVIDLSELDEGEAEAQRLATEDARRPFDLARGPVWRASLIKQSEQRHVLLVMMHHIITDGWSTGVLFGELSVIYDAFSRREPSPLPDLPIQFADFALREQQRLTPQVIEGQLTYWRRQLQGAPQALDLPTDYPRPSVKSYRGSTLSASLPQSLADSLKALCNREGVTLFMLLLAGFKALLCRYSGEEDIIVGSPVAGRNHVDTEGLIGCFVNLLVLRTELSGNPAFAEVMRRVREVTLGAYAHQDMPFAKLVDEIRLKREQTPIPLVQVLFSYDEAARAEKRLAGGNSGGPNADRGTMNVDLNMFTASTEDGIVTSLRYDTDLFAAPTIGRMLEHFRELLEAVVRNPECRLFDIPLSVERKGGPRATSSILIDKYANDRFAF